MNRIFDREDKAQADFTAARGFKIGVLGMSCGVGTTFVATGLALKFAESGRGSVGFADAAGYRNSLAKNETCAPCLYDAMGLDRRFGGRSFRDVFRLAEQGQSIRGVKNIEAGINWAVPTGDTVRGQAGERDKPPRTEEDGAFFGVSASVINNLYADTVICDLGAASGDREFIGLLREFDALVCVIDPYPSRLIAGYGAFSQIRKRELEAQREAENAGSTGNAHGRHVYVMNRMNGGVNRRQALGYLKLRSYTELPLAPQELFYEAEYRCRLPMEMPKIRKIFSGGMDEIHKIITTV